MPATAAASRGRQPPPPTCRLLRTATLGPLLAKAAACHVHHMPRSLSARLPSTTAAVRQPAWLPLATGKDPRRGCAPSKGHGCLLATSATGNGRRRARSPPARHGCTADRPSRSLSVIQPPKQSFTQQPPHQDNGGDVREETHDQFKPVCRAPLVASQSPGGALRHLTLGSRVSINRSRGHSAKIATAKRVELAKAGNPCFLSLLTSHENLAIRICKK